jgi:Family of unknown function (DUF6223)
MFASHLFGSLEVAAPAAAHILAQPRVVDGFTLTAGRAWSVAAALLGLAGVVIGGLALARSVRRVGRTGAVAGVLTGSACMVIGGLVVAGAEGGPGTGYGIVGGYVDLVVGLAAIVIGVLALTRSRHSA